MMKKQIIIIIAALCAFPAFMQAQCIQRDEQIETRIEAILSKMTLEEKVGQMCEVTGYHRYAPPGLCQDASSRPIRRRNNPDILSKSFPAPYTITPSARTSVCGRQGHKVYQF